MTLVAKLWFACVAVVACFGAEASAQINFPQVKLPEVKLPEIKPPNIQLPSPEDVGRVILLPHTGGFEYAGQLLKGELPSKAAAGVLAPAGKMLSQGAQSVQSVHDFVYAYPRGPIRSNLGQDWVNAYDIVTASERLKTHLFTTSAGFFGQCLQGKNCDARTIAAISVSAALKDAYLTYIDRGLALHPDIIKLFSPVVPKKVLETTVVAIGDIPNLTFPGFINSGFKIAGKKHAVTIGNLIILSDTPSFSDHNDIKWVLHELKHHEQYRAHGENLLEAIEGFAFDYINRWHFLEAEAEETASKRYTFLDDQGYVHVYLNPGPTKFEVDTSGK